MLKFMIFALYSTLLVHIVSAKLDKHEMMEIGKKCRDENAAGKEDVRAMLHKEELTTREGKCMAACILKTLGVMKENGKFDEAGYIALGKEAFGDDEKKLDMVQKFVDHCANRVSAVEDDENGCERAAEMHKCSMEMKEQLGMKMDFE